MHRADLVTVPSAERAGWLAARGRLRTLPVTILNAPYAAPSAAGRIHATPTALLPPTFAGKRLVVHTGGVTRTQMVVELVESMIHWPNDACLAITNVSGSSYAQEVRRAVDRSPRKHDVVLLPMLEREAMLSLQRQSVVGVCLLRAGHVPETLMPAPNKIGEYLHAGLVVVGIRMPYFNELEHHGVAVLADTEEPEAIGVAVAAALDKSLSAVTTGQVRDVARSWYCMNVQVRPVLRLIEGAREARDGVQGREHHEADGMQDHMKHPRHLLG
jgi:hypothetical protein